jgi:hypothetical protein
MKSLLLCGQGKTDEAAVSGSFEFFLGDSDGLMDGLHSCNFLLQALEKTMLLPST